VVNGNVHKDSIIDPDGNIVVAETEHNRGRLYEITFNADKAGMYTLRCDEHKENMTAVITVVPN
jgi:plastocyanin